MVSPWAGLLQPIPCGLFSHYLANCMSTLGGSGLPRNLGIMQKPKQVAVYFQYQYDPQRTCRGI